MLSILVGLKKKRLISVFKFLNLAWHGFQELPLNKGQEEQVERARDTVIDFIVVHFFRKWTNLVSLKYLKLHSIKSFYF